MSNLIFVSPSPNKDSTTITTSVTNTDPVSNLLLKQPSLKWVSDAATTVDITIDTGDNEFSFDLVWLGYTNLSDSATYRVRSADSEGGLTSSPDYDSTEQTFAGEGWDRPHLLHNIASVQSNRWILLTLTDTSLTHFEAGRLLIGKRTELPRNIDYGWSVTHLDGTLHRETQVGIDLLHENWQKRKFDFQIRFFTKNQMFQTIEPLIRKHGKHLEILVLINKDEEYILQSLMLYGWFSRDTTISNQDLNFYEKRFIVTELI